MRIYPFFIPHEGCPHRCIFCQQNRISGVYHPPSPAVVFETLDHVLPERGDGEVAFYGGTFTQLAAERQRAYLQQVEPFIRNGRVSGIRVSTRPDALDDEKIVRLQKHGVTTVELGCQSFSSQVLMQTRRGYGPASAASAVLSLRDRGMQVGLQLMPGLPGGDRQEAIFSLESAIALEPDFLRLYPTVVLKGTGLEKAYLGGIFQPLLLDEAVDLCADLLLLCRRFEVPVIRLGLQATDELSKFGTLVAGPYHPAFGQLVRSRLWRRALCRGLAAFGTGKIAVHPSDLSDALGHRRENLLYLQEQHSSISIQGQRGVLKDQFLLGDRSFSLYPLP